MHIVDGALAPEVLIGGGVLAVAGLGLGLRKLPIDKIPATGVLSATFFVASLIHVPVGPSSVHLIMSGLAGLVLGWTAFGTFRRAFVAGHLFRIWRFDRIGGQYRQYCISCGDCRFHVSWIGVAKQSNLCGNLGRVCRCAFNCADHLVRGHFLGLSGEGFVPAAKLVFFAHIPIMAVEGLVSAAAVYLIMKVKPALLMADTQTRRYDAQSPAILAEQVNEANNG